MGPPQHTVSIQQQVAAQGGQVLQAQGGQVLTTAQSNNTTITTMSPLQQAQATAHPQQISTDWGHSRVSQNNESLINILLECVPSLQLLVQQQVQNPTYLPQLYNTQGQLLVPNIHLHPGINPQQIQVRSSFV